MVGHLNSIERGFKVWVVSKIACSGLISGSLLDGEGGGGVHMNAQNHLKSNSHEPNLHACIIYICVNILPVCIFVHANANTHRSLFTYV